MDAAQSILENHFPCGLWQMRCRLWENSLDKGLAHCSPTAKSGSLPVFREYSFVGAQPYSLIYTRSFMAALVLQQWS